MLTVRLPRLVLVNVQVTVSPGWRLSAVTGPPSEQLVSVRSHPVTAVAGAPWAHAFDCSAVVWRRAVGQLEALVDRVRPPVRLTLNSWRSPLATRRGHLVGDHVTPLDVGEGAGDAPARREGDLSRGVAARTGSAGLVPARRHCLRHSISCRERGRHCVRLPVAQVEPRVTRAGEAPRVTTPLGFVVLPTMMWPQLGVGVSAVDVPPNPNWMSRPAGGIRALTSVARAGGVTSCRSQGVGR